MGKIAFVFSGQGAQKAGMGKAFYEANEAVKKLFDDAECLRERSLKNYWNSRLPYSRCDFQIRTLDALLVIRYHITNE